MLAKKIAYNTFISALSKIISLALGLIIISLTTRYLGQSGFGEYSTILAFLFIFSILSDLGLYSIGVREISKEGADEEKIISNIFTIKLISGLLIFGLAPFLGFIFPYSYQVKLGLFIAAFGYWVIANTQVLIGIFQKYLRMDKVALAEVLSRSAQLIMVIFFIYKNLGFFSIISAFSLSALINFFFVFYFAQKYVRIKLEFDFSFWKRTLVQSYPLALSILLTTLYFKLDTVLLSVMKSSVDVGIYSLPYKVLENLIFFPAMFIGLIMPLMSKYVFLEPERFKVITQKALDILLIITIPLVVGTLFLSRPIIFLLGGSDFTESITVLNILIFATAIIFLATIFYNMIIVLDKQKSLIWIYGLGAIFNITANLIFIPKFSYYATSVNSVLTELLVTILMLVVIYRTLGYLLSFKLVFKVGLASLIMAGFLYFLSNYHLLILLLVSLLVYFIFLYLLKGISKEDILILVRKA